MERSTIKKINNSVQWRHNARMEIQIDFMAGPGSICTRTLILIYNTYCSLFISQRSLFYLDISKDSVAYISLHYLFLFKKIYFCLKKLTLTYPQKLFSFVRFLKSFFDSSFNMAWTCDVGWDIIQLGVERGQLVVGQPLTQELGVAALQISYLMFQF